MERSTFASADCFLRWRSKDALHTDRQHFAKLDFWRDLLPGKLGEELLDGDPGEEAHVDISPGEQVADVDPDSVHLIKAAVIGAAFNRRRMTGPYEGRFYPRGLLAGTNGFSGIFQQDLHPFRVAFADHDLLSADLNHPLAGFPLKLGARIGQFLKPREERGGHCNDVLAEMAENGPGMQCPPKKAPVRFLHEHAFDRVENGSDVDFYQTPRLVNHVDAQARAFINEIYRRFIRKDTQVLDLMSSWVSHLDGIPGSVKVTGLGMNAEEMDANSRLSSSLVRDLNEQARLPFADASFDTAVCTVSVEYLIQPVETFTEVARVLKPGGHFIVTFSDRWFPPKVVQIWAELHPFERMGLVLDYFRQTGMFTDLSTESYRGWPRPTDDKYYPQRFLSDPVFAVWGQRAPDKG